MLTLGSLLRSLMLSARRILSSSSRSISLRLFTTSRDPSSTSYLLSRFLLLSPSANCLSPYWPRKKSKVLNTSSCSPVSGVLVVDSPLRTTETTKRSSLTSGETNSSHLLSSPLRTPFSTTMSTLRLTGSSSGLRCKLVTSKRKLIHPRVSLTSPFPLLILLLPST